VSSPFPKRKSIVETLCRKGCNLNEKNKEFLTPLHIATGQGDFHIDFFVFWFAFYNRNVYSFPMLMSAEVLLGSGTPVIDILILFPDKSHYDVMELLLKHGAKVKTFIYIL
jgi:hypothetical protein